MPIVIAGFPYLPTLPPTLLTPADLTYDNLSGTPTFTWQYNAGTPGNTQLGWVFFRVNGGGTYNYWNVSTTKWQLTQVVNSGSAQSLTFPASAWPSGTTWNWSVATLDASGLSAFAYAFTVVSQTVPTVTVTAPSGSIANAQPSITWLTSALLGGAAQTGYHVIIYNAAQYGAGGFTPGVGPSVYDSGVVGGKGGSPLPLTAPPNQGAPAFLPNSTSYRAYVQITITGGQTTAWAYSSFATSFTAPDAPSITATATNDFSTGCPMIQIAVLSDSATQPEVILLRSDGLYVRGASTANPGGTTPHTGGGFQATVNDYEVIPTESYTYTATVVIISTTTVISLTTTSSAAIVPGGQGWWELDPTDSTTAINAQLVTYNPQVTEQSTSHLVMGQAQPNVIANAMGKTDGTGQFETFSAAVYNGLRALLQSQKSIFISDPFGDTLGVQWVRFGPQTGAMSTGSGNTVKSANLQPSTASGPHRTVDVTWVGALRPTV